MAAGEIGLQLGMALSTAGAEQGTEVPTARTSPCDKILACLPNFIVSVEANLRS